MGRQHPMIVNCRRHGPTLMSIFFTCKWFFGLARPLAHLIGINDQINMYFRRSIDGKAFTFEIRTQASEMSAGSAAPFD